MTATQPDSDRQISRRGVLRKGTAVGVGSAATIGGASRMGASPVGSAAAVGPLLAAGAAAGAAGLGYLMYRKVDNYLGSNKDLTGYTGKDALLNQLEEEVLLMKSADERVMTSIQNNIANSENVALSKGKAAAITKMNAQAPESEAVAALEKAINEYYATIEENIFNHYNAQIDQVLHHITQVVANSDLNSTNILSVWTDGKGNGIDKHEIKSIDNEDTKQVTLLNGETIEETTPQLSTLLDNEFDKTVGDIGVSNYNTGSETKWVFRLNNTASGNSPYYMEISRFASALSDVRSRCDTVKTKLGGFVSDLYTEYEPGQIPTEDIVDPVTAATELKQDTGLASQAAAAGMLGIPTSAGFSLRLELQNDSGDKYAVPAEIYTNAQPNDTDGNPAGFAVGQTYNPANFTEPIYVSYEYIDTETGEETTDFTQVDNPFTVLEATNESGESVEEVSPTSTVNQTSDISTVEEELAQIRDRQQTLLEQQDSTQSAGGAGAGFFSGSGPSTGVIAAVVGGIGVLYALTQGGTN